MKTVPLIALRLQALVRPVASSMANANHVFNAIHDSMRQFGNSLNHNGMSFFIANVPSDTEFYHGTSSSEPIQGIQWLAFEPEHALMFAKPERVSDRHDQPVDGTRRPDLSRERREMSHGADRKTADGYSNEQGGPVSDGSQARMVGKKSIPKHETGPFGYLHTYRTNRDLRLLYLDGQSAAKSTLGTLDTQDVVLREKDDCDAPSPIVGDRERAKDLCKMAHTQWGGQIDGFLRMVGGFEMILCSFARNLDIVHIKAVAQHGKRRPGDNLDYQRAIATRDLGIGGNRVSLDYDSFLSLFAFPGVVYFDTLGRPRVDKTSRELSTIRSIISSIALDVSKNATTDWQAVTDMIVSRYAERLELWTSGTLDSSHALFTGLQRALRPFIDDQNRNEDNERQRCATQFLPYTADTNSIAARAVRTVSEKLCSALLSAVSAPSPREALTILQDLRGFLQWTVWKKCKGCAIDEVCRTPIWPTGDAKDFEQPHCTKNSSRADRGDYWDFSGRPRHGA